MAPEAASRTNSNSPVRLEPNAAKAAKMKVQVLFAQKHRYFFLKIRAFDTFAFARPLFFM